MFGLAWSNLMHRKLRTALSTLAVGIGIALLLVSKGLASGSIGEVGQRMQSVDAELIVIPAQDNIIFTNGAPFAIGYDRWLRSHADARGPLAADVVPVFFGQVRLGGQQQRLFGVDPRQMQLFLGTRRVVAGTLFDRAAAFGARVDAAAAATDGTAATAPAAPSYRPAEDAAPAAWEEFLSDGLELVIDERLARVGPQRGGPPYQIGDRVRVMGYEFRIVGIVEAGVAGRVFAPLQTLREISLAGRRSSSMFFVKLRDGLDPVAAGESLASAAGEEVRIELKSDYGKLLRESFAQVDLYMTASSGLALVVCLLFILLTMYTMVLERTREIGILKALGLSRRGLVQLTLLEAGMIAVAGVALGIALAFLTRAAFVKLMPLLTVELAPAAIALAAALGVLGGLLGALYPGWRAARLDPAVAVGGE